MNPNVQNRTVWHMRPKKTQISLCLCESSLSTRRNLNPWLSKVRPVKILIRLRIRAAWSESVLGDHVRRFVFWHCDSSTFRFFRFNESIWNNWKIEQLSSLFRSVSSITNYSTIHEQARQNQVWVLEDPAKDTDGYTPQCGRCWR